MKIEESYYHFEPISGYALESDYYKIIDDNYLTYAVSYEGQFMGYNTCQHVMKMKQGVPEALPKTLSYLQLLILSIHMIMVSLVIVQLVRV